MILRATRVYALLLFQSGHPQHLGNALEHERVFDHLWDAVIYEPHLRRVIVAERQDLQQGDIPMFTTCPSSRNLLSSQGQLIEDFCSEASMELVRRRLDQMNEDDLARQLWIIEGSFATLSTESENMSVTPAVPPTQLQASEVAHAQLMQAACAVGDRLKALALKSGQGVNWLGINMVRETQGKMFWNLQVLKPMALYDGLPGVILFLAYLGEVTGNAMYSDIARSAWVTVQKAVETLLLPDPSALGLPRRLYPLGAFEGSGSHTRAMLKNCWISWSKVWSEIRVWM